MLERKKTKLIFIIRFITEMFKDISFFFKIHSSVDYLSSRPPNG